jgi:TonB family protein
MRHFKTGMAPTRSTPSLPRETSEGLFSNRILLAFLLLAALLHIVLFFYKVSWLPTKPIPRVEIQKIDPRKLQEIKKKWKEKGLLLDRDSHSQSETVAPENSRYFSDRNIRVEKEQRAKTTSPSVKAETSPQSEPSTKSRSKSSAQLRSKPLPDLKSLGIQLPSLKPNRLLAQKGPSANKTERAKPTRPRSEEGGPQYLKEDRLPDGNQNLLNAQESVFYSFYARIYDAIGPLWQSQIRQTPHPMSLQDGDYSTLVDIVLDSTGNLIGVHLLQSSGVKEFDQTVDTSWRKLDKFPNPPAGLLNQEKQIHMAWTFTVHASRGLFFEPPSRTR